MSRGNINYRYLRRRKNKLYKNLKIFLWILIALLAISGITFAVIKIKDSGVVGNYFNSLSQKSSDESQSKEEATEVQSTQATNVVWIDDKEPQSKEVSYTPPKDIQYPYMIKVNRAANCVTVYGIDASGSYTIAVKAFACSCGKEGNETITGDNYKTTDQYLWRLMVDNTYGHYATRIYGSYLFHSVPYLTSASNSLETAEYNKLGSFASLGCVRMCVRDVKWVYDNCPQGTKVSIYDDASNPGPLGKPESIKIPENSPNAGWDPTDPDESNPWSKCSASISGTKDIKTKIGQKVNLLDGITATDTCGNDITSKVITVGHYTFDQAGDYNVKYEVTDAIGSKAEVTVKLTVK